MSPINMFWKTGTGTFLHNVDMALFICRRIWASLGGQSLQYLVCDATVSACVPWDEVCDQPLDPATVLGAEVLPRQPHVPVRTGPQHGQEGHEVACPIHGELCRRSSSSGENWQRCLADRSLFNQKHDHCTAFLPNQIPNVFYYHSHTLIVS